jgi:hypothetical protein
MPSMTLMMSTILSEDALMAAMVSTTCCTAWPPSVATLEAELARVLAAWALSAFWRTVEVSCSMAEAVSSMEPAWASVREDRSLLPAAISADAVSMVLALLRTLLTMRTRLSVICWMACIN